MPPRCHTYRNTHCVSCYGFDLETPFEDYEIRFVRVEDPDYIPPDSEAWPLYFQAVTAALATFPDALQAVRRGVQTVLDQVRGRRALPPDRATRDYPLPN